ncbi:MAG: hypothetical protein HY744_28890 [Deltaproteobacteria bacterium]|nr:hypothetical protein [Deltaproteobacteria bacterium]
MNARLFSTVAMTLLAALGFAAPAAAQEAPAKAASPAGPAEQPPCPPGAYCEPATLEPPPELAEPAPERADEGGRPDATTVVIPPPPPGADPNAPRVLVIQPGRDGEPGQVIVYESGAVPPGLPVRPLPPPPPLPPQRKWLQHREWGMNLRIDGVLMPRFRGDVHDSGMVGLGLSLRYRPIPHFAIDASSDFVGGVDANGFDRQELPLSLGAMLFANPRDPVQFYAFGGVGWAFARVFAEHAQTQLADDGLADEYSYFGGQAGIGVEFRVSPLVGLNIDGLAFMRTRTDSDADGKYPEFLDERSGERSNTSVAGMVRAGVTFWW